MAEICILAALPQLQRLALAYAPATSRPALTALFALDARLAGIVRNSHEPMLAQLRLTWWREELTANGGASTVNDPLLQLLHNWPGSKAALSGLADGWEAMTGPPPLSSDMFIALAEARGRAFAALADLPEVAAIALRMGRSWALADIADHLSDARERETVRALVQAQDWRWQRLPRKLRSLAVLHGLAARTVCRDSDSGSRTPGALLVAMRIGMMGR